MSDLYVIHYLCLFVLYPTSICVCRFLNGLAKRRPLEILKKVSIFSVNSTIDKISLGSYDTGLSEEKSKVLWGRGTRLSG